MLYNLLWKYKQKTPTLFSALYYYILFYAMLCVHISADSATPEPLVLGFDTWMTAVFGHYRLQPHSDGQFSSSHILYIVTEANSYIYLYTYTHIYIRIFIYIYIYIYIYMSILISSMSVHSGVILSVNKDLCVAMVMHRYIYLNI